MISLAQTVHQIETTWRTEFQTIPTRMIGERLDADRLPAWAELWIVPQDPPAGRLRGIERRPIEAIVHLFVEPRQSLQSIEVLIDLARGVLEHRTLDSPFQTIRFRELTIRDLSRDDDDGLASRHLVLVAPADVFAREPTAA